MILYWRHRRCRVESGWDPVTHAYAADYANHEFARLDTVEATLDELEAWNGPLMGKRVLDLGAGPGQYSIQMARRGAVVTWHDPSRAYQAIAEERARAAGISLRYSLGLLEDTRRWVHQPFEIVFNRICWYYSLSDRSFAELVMALLVSGGTAYIDANNTNFYQECELKPRAKAFITLACWLNRIAGVKLGYVHPPRGRLLKELSRYPIRRMKVDYSSVRNDRFLITKA